MIVSTSSIPLATRHDATEITAIKASLPLALLVMLALPLLCSRAIAETALVPFGSKTQWRYLDDGRDLGTAWLAPAFDDTAWRSGSAPLGFGDPEVATRISFGRDPQLKHITTYFRHVLDCDAASELQQLVFRIRSDDGIVVYLNGKEVLRNNMPAGEIAFGTTAVKSLNDIDERLWRHFRMPATSLHRGRNVLAVEVHQSEAVSSDLFLDVELLGYGPHEELRPVVASAAREQTEAFLKQHRIAEGQRIVDGYLDGGRRATLGADGVVQSAREVLLVDRKRDEALRRHLEFAGSLPLRALPPLDRATVLATYVDRVLGHVCGRKWYLAADQLLVAEYHGEPVLLGDVPRLCSSGVCRHRSLLYKLLADEAGLKVALVRGGVRTSEGVGEHAWNELDLEDQGRLIVDTMGLPETAFPDARSDAASHYFDVKDQPIYGIRSRTPSKIVP